MSAARKSSSTPRKSALSAPTSGTPRQHVGSTGSEGDTDGDDPLSHDFNPSQLKVAELRSLLFQHNVHPPSSARKPALIEAYEEHVRGNADELRAMRNRDLNVRPDNRGIVFLRNGQVQRSPSASAPSTDGEEDSAASNDDDTAPRRRHAGGRRSVSWAESVGSGEEEVEVEDVADSSAANISSFSLENPFQSSPGTPSRITSPRASEPAKRSTGASAAKAKKELPAALRRSLPASKAKAKVEVEDADDSADADVSRQSSQKSPSPTVQRQKRMRQWVDHAKEDIADAASEAGEKLNGGAASGFFSTALFVVLAGWWLWYTHESKAIGFCDSGRRSNPIYDAWTAARVERQGRARNGQDSDPLAYLYLPAALRPTCTPCPPHARCSAGKLTGCESSDYVERAPFLSRIPLLRSAVPLSSVAPSCHPDEERLLLAADLADEIENRLRTWKGDVYCNRERARLGPRDEPDWGQEGVYALPLSDVYHDLKTEAERGAVLRSQTNDFFRSLWGLAMADLESSGRVQQRSSRLLAVRGPMGVGLSCRVSLGASSVWRRLRLWLAGITLVGLTLQWLRWRLRGTSQLHRKAYDLVDIALEKLQTAKARHVSAIAHNGSTASPSTAAEPYLSITQLRDSVLRHDDAEMSDAKRKTLWARVSKRVEANTNVRTRQAKVQGEWTRVWEWVGPLSLLDNGNGQEMQQSPSSRSARLSLPSSSASSSQHSIGVEQDDRGHWARARNEARFDDGHVRQHDYNAGRDRRPSAEI